MYTLLATRHFNNCDEWANSDDEIDAAD